MGHLRMQRIGKIKPRLFVLILLIFISCKDKGDELGFQKVELNFVASKEDKILRKNGFVYGEFLTFKLMKYYYEDEADSISWSKGILITFPKNDNSFILSNDSLHKFSLFISTDKGLSDVKIKSITEGELFGKKIDSLTWSLNIKTKDFSLERILSFEMNKIKTIRLK